MHIMEKSLRRELKSRARQSVKKHYIIFVFVMLLCSLLGTDYKLSSALFKSTDVYSDAAVTVDLNAEKESSVFNGVLVDLLSGDYEKGQELSESFNAENAEHGGARFGFVEFGRQKGIFASVANNISSGSMLLTVLNFISAMTGSSDASYVIFVVFILLFNIFEIGFLVKTYKVVYARMFLEAREYDKVGSQALTFLIRVGKYMKAALTMIYTWIFHLLWSLTIVGYFIKYYEYMMVPYIVAENPSIKAKDAVKLSKNIMYGHKWEAFTFDISFLFWLVLDVVSSGIGGIFFVTPYLEASKCEYYVHLRGLAKENNIEGIEALNDVYLYTKASEEVVREAYADIVALAKEPEPELPKLNPVRRFFESAFGLVLHYDDTEKQYREYMVRKQKIDNCRSIIDGKMYPNRLSQIPAKEHRSRIEHTYYLRHYSVSSVILIFFLFSFVGWLWEVSIHIVKDHAFVNRGMLHGPWIPIYGAGAVMILLLLKKFREKPVVEFVSAIVLCGLVEYFTSYFVEITHNGMRWWDYSGYFLNINGRVCAEGLLVFGLGGIAAVYIAAPFVDNKIARHNKQLMISLAVVLSVIFVVDMIYSKHHPNAGKGITDYDTSVINTDYSEDDPECFTYASCLYT